MRIAFAGGGYLGYKVLSALLDSEHEIVAYVEDGRKVRGVHRFLRPLLYTIAFWVPYPVGLAKRRGLPIVFIDKMTEDELAPLHKLDLDLLIIAGFGIIIKPPLIELPRIGCVNCHSSLLPKHRGANPFGAVILADEKETGVTYHIVDPGIDTGDILLQAAFSINPDDNAMNVHHQASDVAAANLPDLLEQIERDGLVGTPQDDSQSSYDKKWTNEDLTIDWSKPAEYLARLVRAAFPYRLVRFQHKGQTIYVSRASADPTPVNAEPGTVIQPGRRARIATGEGSLILEIAYKAKPIPWIWPSSSKSPAYGERLE
jgi:methionyl-tRNA formyltransferase